MLPLRSASCLSLCLKLSLRGGDSKAKDATYNRGYTDLKFAISVIIAIFGNHSVLHIF